jgi:hypothetical protein
MQGKANHVTDYLQEIPEERRECLTTLTGYEESMDYSRPCYKKNGIVEVGFASQKNYIARLAGLSVGKGGFQCGEEAARGYT